MTALAIPTLPCKDLDQTLEFYAQLGFRAVFVQREPDTYAIVLRGTAEIHFFGLIELEPEFSNAGCYIRVKDVDQWYDDFCKADLPQQGIPRISPVHPMPWDMREFHLIDPNGNLLRIGARTEEVFK